MSQAPNPKPWPHGAPGPEGSAPAPSLPALWVRRWADDPNATTVCASDGTRWSAAEFEHRSASAAHHLWSLGVRPGDRVLWSAPTSLGSVVACIGALRLGAVVIPSNPAYTEPELAHIVADARPGAALVARAEQAAWITRAGGPKVVVVELERVGDPRAHPGEAVPGSHGFVLDVAGPADPAVIVYTSGTTGAPKGAVLTHANLVAGCESLREAWDVRPDDRLALALPLFHVHGLCVGLFTSLAAGASVVLLDRFDPGEVLDQARRGASLFFGVPTMYRRLAAHSRITDLARLRLCVSGSAPLSPSLFGEICERTGVSILERYGMTETLLTLSNPLRGERRAGRVGFALPGVEARLDRRSGGGDDGSLQIRGPTVFAGYWERPAQTEECFDGDWFDTGDTASVDADGYVSIRGRRQDLIISGGFNVYPAEVEDVLAAHPGVAEVAVTGTPSEEWGEVVTAWVVPTVGHRAPDDLVTFAQERLAPFKRPRVVRTVDSLPRNAMGKVQRHELG